MESTEPLTSPATFGEGDFPAHLNRINWPAVMLSEIFALLHGQIKWWFGFIALGIVASVVQSLDFADISIRLAAVGFVSVGVRVLFGLQANRLLWERAGAQRRGETHLTVGLPQSVEQFPAWQRSWNWMAAILLGGPLLCLVVTSLDRIVAPRAEPTIVLAIALVPVLVGWAIDRRRARLTSASS